MPASKAHQRASNKWIAKAYDRVNLTLPKGQKDVIQAHAFARGESVNGFIGRAIAETMERDGGGTESPSNAAVGPSEGSDFNPVKIERVQQEEATPIPSGADAAQSVTERGEKT